ncbi:MAG: cation:proton antiporter [Candidatus Gastranaerophilales bacterium]|nr:cation:proton antiporter [Candidatus Gastranaerophilales bacterium]
MSQIILFCSIVIFSCIITNKFSSKLGIPTLVFFMFFGILFGCDGLLKISFDDFDLTSKLCSIGLLFIIFYGGFCTKKSDNKIATTQAITKNEINLCETIIDKDHDWLNKKINEIGCSCNFLIALIKRNEDYFVPNSDSEILLNDALIFYEA